MEYASGIKLRDILLDNGNWWKFFLTHRRLIRTSIIINVLKVLVGRTRFLGYRFFVCPKCHQSIKAPHSCKSRFCSSCGKKATDDWIKNSFNTLPDTTWQHITFTMPNLLWDFFWVNRYLTNKIPLTNLWRTFDNPLEEPQKHLRARLRGTLREGAFLGGRACPAGQGRGLRGKEKDGGSGGSVSGVPATHELPWKSGDALPSTHCRFLFFSRGIRAVGPNFGTQRKHRAFYRTDRRNARQESEKVRRYDGVTV
ncbi:MAG: hypothetical protein B1H02_00520 [Candidatus Latescibacteria bacterium 4484_107]|nr:MAG: hypothetical protein B1H02_00520 [Candidatus Latescibacteria bacterium 4484_107]